MALHYITVFGLAESDDGSEAGEFIMESHLLDFGERLTEARVIELMGRIYGVGAIERVEIVRE